MQCFLDRLPIVLIDSPWRPTTSAGFDQYTIPFTQGEHHDHACPEMSTQTQTPQTKFGEDKIKESIGV